MNIFSNAANGEENPNLSENVSVLVFCFNVWFISIQSYNFEKRKLYYKSGWKKYLIFIRQMTQNLWFLSIEKLWKKNYIYSAVTKAFVIPVPFFALIFFVEIKFMFAIADPR